MATLILTAVGSALGGPIGGAIGAIAGQAIDGELFRPAARQGPRLANLTVQTSSYGSQIPKMFGTMRVAGTVAWATDLIEAKKTSGGGKGRAATETYSYSASFAVLLSARRIVRVGRIWADGKLLRGEAGDLKVGLGALRVHDGDADQSVDPLIAAAEGASAPAWRGTAYAVFEHLQLADYGNRIPSLSFEVIADEGSVAVGTMIVELAGSDVLADPGPLIGGFAASGTTVRSLTESIDAAFPMICGDADGVRIRFSPVGMAEPDAGDLGASADDKRHARIAREVLPLEMTAATVSFSYSDPARDYQAGVQRARRQGAGNREDRIDLPASCDAGAAQVIAERALAERGVARSRANIALPWRGMTFRPGDSFSLEGSDWRVVEMRLERMTVQLDLVQHVGAASLSASAEPGRAVAELDALHGRTVLRVLDLPALNDAAASAPMVGICAAGASPGWRRAALFASRDGGASHEAVGATALPARMGATLTVLRAGATAIIDRANAVDVALLNGSMLLSDADEAALLAGANLALVDDEVFQFGRATLLPSGAWRLAELWRGRRGTEDMAVAHPAGTPFTMLDADTIALLPPSFAVPGVRVLASGLGDVAPYPEVSCVTALVAVTPLSPAQPRVGRLPSGDTQISWVRRSRSGWGWRDGVDVPLGEEGEAYRISWPGGSADVAVPIFLYTAAMRAADAAGGATTALIEIRQIGAAALSRPLTLSVALI